MKLSFRLPINIDVLVVDKTAYKVLSSSVLNNMNHANIVFDKRHLNISLKVAIYFMGLLKEVMIDICCLGSIKGIFSTIYRYLALSALKAIKPKIVITFIDDSSLFGWLSEKYKEATFYSIQNGTRTQKALKEQTVVIPNYFCFGDYEVEEMSPYWKVNSYIPVGSLMSSVFMEKKEPLCSHYDIVLISQQPNLLTRASGVAAESASLMDDYLSRYVSENNLKFAVACRYKNNSLEIGYYKSKYGRNVELVFRDDAAMACYQAMYSSELVVTFYSTAAREAAGWGRKVLFCDFTNTNLYNNFQSGLWIFRERSYKNFAERMTGVMRMSKIEYERETKDYFKKIMYFNSVVPTYRIIRNELVKVLNCK